jgi:hypothetical protein
MDHLLVPYAFNKIVARSQGKDISNAELIQHITEGLAYGFRDLEPEKIKKFEIPGQFGKAVDLLQYFKKNIDVGNLQVVQEEAMDLFRPLAEKIVEAAEQSIDHISPQQNSMTRHVKRLAGPAAKG